MVGPAAMAGAAQGTADIVMTSIAQQMMSAAAVRANFLHTSSKTCENLGN